MADSRAEFGMIIFRGSLSVPRLKWFIVQIAFGGLLSDILSEPIVKPLIDKTRPRARILDGRVLSM
jgi:hypothetical protein